MIAFNRLRNINDVELIIVMQPDVSKVVASCGFEGTCRHTVFVRLLQLERRLLMNAELLLEKAQPDFGLIWQWKKAGALKCKGRTGEMALMIFYVRLKAQGFDCTKLYGNCLKLHLQVHWSIDQIFEASLSRMRHNHCAQAPGAATSPLLGLSILYSERSPCTSLQFCILSKREKNVNINMFESFGIKHQEILINMPDVHPAHENRAICVQRLPHCCIPHLSVLHSARRSNSTSNSSMSWHGEHAMPKFTTISQSNSLCHVFTC